MTRTGPRRITRRFLVSLPNAQMNFIISLIEKHSFIRNRQDAIRYIVDMYMIAMTA